MFLRREIFNAQGRFFDKNDSCLLSKTYSVVVQLPSIKNTSRN
jgi:hypothetical protein